MKEKVVIVIPFYQINLNDGEKISLEQTKKIFKNRPIVYISPERIRESIKEDCRVEYFEDYFFDGREGYNELMLSPQLYDRFKDFEYILICQLDVFIFEDRLDYFCNMNFDYIGAPWLKGAKSYEGNGYKVTYVGNGGLSLRNVEKMSVFLKNNKPQRAFWEDYYISSFDNELKIAPLEYALEFAFEGELKRCFEITKKLPMGIHGWWRFDLDFIKETIEKAGYCLKTINDEKYDEKKILLNYKELDRDEVILKEEFLQNNSIFSKDIVIWGAGYYGDIIGWILRKIGINCFIYVDKNEGLAGRLHGQQIISDRQITEDMIRNSVWIVCSQKNEEEITCDLQARGVLRERINSYRYIMDYYRMSEV